ncbi:hypothetical protein BJQ89_01252 [Arthrobacter sp. ES1]|nr:hypothetical protein [Arthrobacter sp. ES1]
MAGTDNAHYTELDVAAFGVVAPLQWEFNDESDPSGGSVPASG